MGSRKLSITIRADQGEPSNNPTALGSARISLKGEPKTDRGSLDLKNESGLPNRVAMRVCGD